MRRGGSGGGGEEEDWRVRLLGAVLLRCDEYDAARAQFAAVRTRDALATCGGGERGGGEVGGAAALGVYFSFADVPGDELEPHVAAAAERLGERVRLVQVVLWAHSTAADRDRERAYTDAILGKPWFAVPFADVHTKRRLTRRYKIATGTPTLVVRGRHVRHALLADPQALHFPWPPPRLHDVLRDTPLRACDSSAAPPALYSQLQRDAVRVFYFAAHWCPPCRAFTPSVCRALAAVRRRTRRHKHAQLILVSSDRSEESYLRTLAAVCAAEAECGGGGALALRWEDATARADSAAALGVSGIPELVLVDREGTVLADEGRAALASDPLAWNFPWIARSCSVLTERTLQQLHRHPAVLLFLEESEAEVEWGLDVLECAASAYREERALRPGGGGDADTDEEEEAEEVRFHVCVSGSPAAERARALAGLDDALPLLAGVELARGRRHLMRYGDIITPVSLQHFVDTFLASPRDPLLPTAQHN